MSPLGDSHCCWGNWRTHHPGWTAAAPGRSDTCPSPPRCWWHSGRWPGWWRRRSLCPCFWCRSAGRAAKCQLSADASARTKAGGGIQFGYLKLPEDGGDVCLVGQVGEDLQLNKRTQKELKGALAQLHIQTNRINIISSFCRNYSASAFDTTLFWLPPPLTA